MSPQATSYRTPHSQRKGSVKQLQKVPPVSDGLSSGLNGLDLARNPATATDTLPTSRASAKGQWVETPKKATDDDRDENSDADVSSSSSDDSEKSGDEDDTNPMDVDEPIHKPAPNEDLQTQALQRKIQEQETELLRLKMRALESENELLRERNRLGATSDDDVRSARAFSRREQLTDARKAVGEYTGSQNPAHVELFITRFNAYAQQGHLTDDEKIAMFERRMSGKATVWWNFYRDTTLAGIRLQHPGQAWDFVESAFKTHFMPRQYQVQLVGKFHDLNTDQGLLQYVRQVQMFVQKSPSTSEEEKWLAIQYKIDQTAKDHLITRNITESTPALEALYEFALGHEKDGRQRKRDRPSSISVNSIKHDNKKSRNDKDRRPRIDKAKYDNVTVSMANYNDFAQLPVITRALRKFIEEHKGCCYCRALNVAPEHTAEACAKEHRSRRPKKDF